MTDIVSVETVTIESIEVGTQGPPGPQGIPGVGSTSITTIPFAFNEVSPVSGGIVTAGKSVLECWLAIDTAFDGVGAALSIGDAGNHESLMNTTQNLPNEVGVYQTNPGTLFGSDTDIGLYITPGTDPSQGAGRFYIVIEG